MTSFMTNSLTMYLHEELILYKVHKIFFDMVFNVIKKYRFGLNIDRFCAVVIVKL